MHWLKIPVKRQSFPPPSCTSPEQPARSVLIWDLTLGPGRQL